LEKDLGNAQGTDFEGTDTSRVSIGTVVSLETEAGRPMEYTVLGAWDSIPEKHVISYLSDIGQALIGGKVGDSVEIRDLDTEENHRVTITAIRAWKS
jgi:transcription elongation GreA/GreB family factor